MLDISMPEVDVLCFTAQGFSDKEIAARLDVGVKTVETCKARASDKLGLRSRAEIVRYGAAKGWPRAADPASRQPRRSPFGRAPAP